MEEPFQALKSQEENDFLNDNFDIELKKNPKRNDHH